jgi:hypothetical protein
LSSLKKKKPRLKVEADKPSTWEGEAGDPEFKPAWATEQDPISKKQTKQKPWDTSSTLTTVQS